ncbi:hypothetical protein B0H17DRAFT_302834 [Mycena rosella]|uniref:Uncharacterized protein n=1 Tax=Mycena rosella TaxID=1033263 RepID=A0AAD7G6D9_MYCRO|nr:hypothetical protein B0H17DRAFT_302834 [Mycena rosella]
MPSTVVFDDLAAYYSKQPDFDMSSPDILAPPDIFELELVHILAGLDDNELQRLGIESWHTPTREQVPASNLTTSSKSVCGSYSSSSESFYSYPRGPLPDLGYYFLLDSGADTGSEYCAAVQFDGAADLVHDTDLRLLKIDSHDEYSLFKPETLIGGRPSDPITSDSEFVYGSSESLYNYPHSPPLLANDYFPDLETDLARIATSVVQACSDDHWSFDAGAPPEPSSIADVLSFIRQEMRHIEQRRTLGLKMPAEDNLQAALKALTWILEKYNAASVALPLGLSEYIERLVDNIYLRTQFFANAHHNSPEETHTTALESPPHIASAFQVGFLNMRNNYQ